MFVINLQSVPQLSLQIHKHRKQWTISNNQVSNCQNNSVQNLGHDALVYIQYKCKTKPLTPSGGKLGVTTREYIIES